WSPRRAGTLVQTNGGLYTLRALHSQRSSRIQRSLGIDTSRVVYSKIHVGGRDRAASADGGLHGEGTCCRRGDRGRGKAKGHRQTQPQRDETNSFEAFHGHISSYVTGGQRQPAALVITSISHKTNRLPGHLVAGSAGYRPHNRVRLCSSPH